MEAARRQRGADPRVHRERIDLHHGVPRGHFGNLDILDPEIFEERQSFTVLPEEDAAVGMGHRTLRLMGLAARELSATTEWSHCHFD